MKSYSFAAIVLLLTACFLTSCKKDDSKTETYQCTTCTTSPEAKAANDGSNKGIYKGIVIGSTGTIKFNLQNDNSTINADLTIDGVAVSLTSSVSLVNGQQYLAPFSGTLNGQPVSITFSVLGNGSSPMVITSSIPGHPNAQFIIAKETSTGLIECFEGTYHTTRPEDGTFNILLSRSLKMWGGIARENGQIGTDDVGGTIQNNTLIDADSGMGVAVLSGDSLNGSFTDSDGKKVDVKGKRTL